MVAPLPSAQSQVLVALLQQVTALDEPVYWVWKFNCSQGRENHWMKQLGLWS